MTPDQTAIIGIIVVVLILFIWGKWRFDVVAFMALMIAVLFGIVSPNEAFSGFGHPATLTVALVLVLSDALSKSGSTEGLSKLIAPMTSHQFTHVASISFLAACLSMFMNNVGALALLMPVAIETANKAGRSPATVLMPLSFGSILGGLVTVIGTPPNIIIATYREKVIGESFQMFDFSPVGGAIALAGVLFITLFGWKLIRINQKSKTSDGIFEIESYISEIKISKESSLVGKQLHELEKELKDLDIVIVSLIRRKQRYFIPPQNEEFLASDILLLEGAHKDIDKFITKYGVSIVTAGGAKADVLHSKHTGTFEAVVAPNSRLEGRTVEQIRFKSNYSTNLLAVSRQGKPYRGRIKSFKVKAGDVFLLHGDTEHVKEVITQLGCLPLAKRGLVSGRRKNAYRALCIFLLAIASTAIGLLPIQIALGTAVIVMVLSNILPPRELYEAIDWPIIVLLAAMLPVGNALESTGATEQLVTYFLTIAKGISPVVLLALVLIITMTLSDILNNAATAILMAPIANSIAIHTNSNVDAFLMAVAIGASCAFLTPIGHQNNALIMGPGGYKFGDYWRFGLPLEILIVLIAVPMIQLVWPL